MLLSDARNLGLHVPEHLIDVVRASSRRVSPSASQHGCSSERRARVESRVSRKRNLTSIRCAAPGTPDGEIVSTTVFGGRWLVKHLVVKAVAGVTLWHAPVCCSASWIVKVLSTAAAVDKDAAVGTAKTCVSHTVGGMAATCFPARVNPQGQQYHENKCGAYHGVQNDARLFR